MTYSYMSSSSSSCSLRVRCFPCSLVLKVELVPPSLLRRPIFRLPSGLYFSACLGSLFLSILCTWCSHFFWYCFISFSMFYAPVFPLIYRIFSLSNFVTPSVSKISSVLLLNVVSLFSSVPKLQFQISMLL